MNKDYYECHITLEGDPVFIEPIVLSLKWKFSKIDGDPVMGKGVKCYATKHFNTKWPSAHVKQIVQHTANTLQRQRITVTREKIELVIYDTKSKYVKLGD